MCWAAHYSHAGRNRQSRFEHGGARLPVSARRGAQVLLLAWGRRPRERGALPAGGWAKLTHIQAGLWDKFLPRPVKLPVHAFAERNVTGQEQWFEITRGQYIQGCVAHAGTERRVYVVTLDCSPEETEYERWPRVVSGWRQ